MVIARKEKTNLYLNKDLKDKAIMPLIIKTIFCKFLFLFIKPHYVTFFYILEFDEIYNNYKS